VYVTDSLVLSSAARERIRSRISMGRESIVVGEVVGDIDVTAMMGGGRSRIVHDKGSGDKEMGWEGKALCSSLG
jgi:hypothetical protein